MHERCSSSWVEPSTGTAAQSTSLSVPSLLVTSKNLLHLKLLFTLWLPMDCVVGSVSNFRIFEGRLVEGARAYILMDHPNLQLLKAAAVTEVNVIVIADSKPINIPGDFFVKDSSRANRPIEDVM